MQYVYLSTRRLNFRLLESLKNCHNPVNGNLIHQILSISAAAECRRNQGLAKKKSRCLDPFMAKIGRCDIASNVCKHMPEQMSEEKDHF